MAQSSQPLALSQVRRSGGRLRLAVIGLLLVALAGGVGWAFWFRIDALSPSPDCPPTGCYAPPGPLVVPLASAVVFIGGVILAAVLARDPRQRTVGWLVWAVLLQWGVMLALVFAFLVD